MSLERNKAVIRRLAMSKGNPAALNDLLAEEFVNYDPTPGLAADRDGYMQSLSTLIKALPDLTVSVEDIIAERDMVAVRVIERGTHRGVLMGVPGTSRVVTFNAMAMFRVTGGRVVERWALADFSGVLRQIGATVAPSSKHA